MSESSPLLANNSPPRIRMSPQLLWKTGAIFATAGIITGAFGAHGFKNMAGITPEKIQAWHTASQYAIYNGLALCLVSLHPRFATHRFAGPAIIAGGFLFSSSIFALVLNSNLKVLGPVTPLGGLVMIAGYTSLIF